MGFRIAEAFVEIKSDATGLRSEVSREVAAAGAGQEIKVGLKVDKGAFGGLMANLAPFVLPTVGAIGQLTGVLGLVPAAAGAAGLAYGTLKVGLDNFSDSLKTGNTPADLKKANEALAELSPVAREAALTVRGLSPAWDSVKLDVQNRMFAGMSSVIKDVARVDLPVLRTGMDAMADSFNRSTRYVAAWVTSSKTIGDLRLIMTNSATATDNFGRALQSVLGMIRDVAAVGSAFLPGLSGGFAEASKRAADFVANARETGKLREWIQTGIDATRKLWDILGNLLQIIIKVGQAPPLFGMNFLSILSAVTGKILDLITAMPELIPMLEAALIIWRAWAVAQWALAGVMPIVRSAIALWTGEQWLLNAAMDANPIGLVIVAIGALVAATVLIITHWQGVKDFLSGVWAWIKATATSIFGPVRDFIVGVWNFVRDVTMTVWNAITDYFGRLWSAHRDLVMSIYTPIRDFIVGIWNRTRDDTMAVWNAISGFFSGVWNGIRGTAINTWNAIYNFLAPALNGFRGFFSGVWNGVVNDFSNIWGRLTGIAQTVWTNVLAAFKWGINQVIGFINRFVIDDVDAVLRFLLIPTIPPIPMLASGGTVGTGFATNGPMAIVGEGNPNHPEYVIPTDPAHRKNALSLYQSLGAQLMESGGILGKVESWLGGGSTSSLNAAIDALVTVIPAGIFRSIAGGIGHKAVSAIQAMVEKMFASSAGGGDLGAWIAAALGITHTSPSWAGPLRTLIMRESGGNPNAINLWDSNAKAGHPSQGLMQTIPGTFMAYHQPGTSFSITDPIANIAAGINYIKARYGTIFNVQQANAALPPKGYDLGGIAVGAGFMPKFTNAPERVLSPQQTQVFDRFVDLLSRGGGALGGLTVNVIQQSGSPAETGRAVALALRTVA